MAIVVALGRHDDRTFYVDLAKTLEIGEVGQQRGEKPACCGENGWPSIGPAPSKHRRVVSHH